MSETVVAVDIGGTHARFAIAEVAGGRVLSLGEATTLHTAHHASFQSAWEAFARREGGVPRSVAIAVAGPVGSRVLRTRRDMAPSSPIRGARGRLRE